MTQCEKCITDDLTLSSNARKWIPLKGKTSLEFYNENNSSKFSLQVIDTVEEARNLDCPDSYQVESIQATLLLNAADSTRIWMQAIPKESISLNARSSTEYYISAGNITYTKDRPLLTYYYSYKFPNRNYKDVVLVIASAPVHKGVDSIYMGNGYGIIAFKFNNIHYYLK
jgi:hypothetical protein